MATGEIVLNVQITDALRGAVFAAFHETVDALVTRYLSEGEVAGPEWERRVLRDFAAWVKATVEDHPDDDESGGG